MIYCFLFSLLFLFGCSESPTVAPIDHDASLQGYITFEEDPSNVLSVSVSIIRDGEIEAINQTQSDSAGFYYFEDLNPGTYQVNFYLLGYEPQSQTVTLISNEITVADTVELMYIPTITVKEIIVDGQIDESWEASYENTHISGWSATNDFSSLYIARDENYLFFAVDGGFDPSQNTINIYVDLDYGNGTGLNDFSNIGGQADFSTVGDHLRKEVSTPLDFGADIAFTAWAFQYDIGVFSLSDESNIDKIDGVLESLNSSVIEFAVPVSALYQDSQFPDGGKIALVAIIADDSSNNFADDSIPQIESGFSGVFNAVFSTQY